MTQPTSLSFGSDHGTTDTVRRSIETGDSLPGTGGFAGVVEGRLVRDVLGRVPLYVDASLVDRVQNGTESASRSRDEHAIDIDDWGQTPTDFDDPIPVPAGSVGFDPHWRLPEPDPVTDHDRILSQLDHAIRRATRLHATDGVAVAFSGGIDSALLAAHLDAPLYVVGFPDSHDIDAARAAASALGRSADLHVTELTLESVERVIPTVARAIGRTNAMDVAIATSLYLVADVAASDGVESLVLGQGADELFGGYEKVHRLDHRVEADTVRGAVHEQLATIPEQLPRDVLAVTAGGVDPITPYLHDQVVSTALRLPTELYGTDGSRKQALRLVASDHLPDSIATRQKKAFQYGSLVSRELDRLARQAGYKRRMDDHVEKYIESRLADDHAD